MTVEKTNQDVEIIDKKTIAKKYFETTEYQLRHKLYDGSWSQKITREIFQRGSVSAVLPYDLERDCVVLIEQFRPGAYVTSTTEPVLHGSSPWLIETVAGVVEANETPVDVAVRELKEEANCEALDIFHVMDWHASPGTVNEPIAFYCARVDSCNAHGIHGLDDEHEDIRVLTVEASTIWQWLANNTLTNATLLIALQWFSLNYERLQNRWSS